MYPQFSANQQVAGRVPVVLSIAGSDNSGGAGIQADIKTATALSCYAATVVTAVTAQNFKGVRAVLPMEQIILKDQLSTFFEAFHPDAIKIGMIPNARSVETIAEVLKEHHSPHIVIDPVIASTSGQSLSGEKEETLKASLLMLYPLAELLTPNLPEAEYLAWLLAKEANETVTLFRGPEECAAEMSRHLPSQAILIKGGHQEGLAVVDRLYGPGKQSCEKPEEFVAQRIQTPNTHGTGCTLSTAIACGLAKGLELSEAIRVGKEYVTLSLQRGKSQRLSPGNGPLGFF